MCYEEAVVEMNIRDGDDDVGRKKSLKKNENERPPREGREATKRWWEETIVKLTISCIFGQMMSQFPFIPHEACVQNLFY